MTEFAQAARRLLAPQQGEGTTSQDVAERAERACKQLSQQLARLVGNNGVTLLLRRSIVLATAEFPWLASAPPAENVTEGDACSTLRAVMERQESDMATEAFIAVLSTFIGLLTRLIGEGLVDRLLYEVWPAIFPQAVKETP